MNPESTLDVTPLGRIGAIVHGITLGAGMSEGSGEAIIKALDQHKVLFFRGQQHLDDAQHHAFAQLVGRPMGNPAFPGGDNGFKIFELDSAKGMRANTWHSDMTFIPAYPKATVLRALTVPASGGSTIWANTACAYQELPGVLKRLADSLRAVHTNDFESVAKVGLTAQKAQDPQAAEQFRRHFAAIRFRTEHPAVRVLPETKDRCLLLGVFARSIQGLPEEDGRALIELFQRYIQRPENTVRWYWQVGDVALWDNRATQHFAVDDYGNQPRLMRRIALEGDLPVGVDGTPSRPLETTADAQGRDLSAVSLSIS